MMWQICVGMLVGRRPWRFFAACGADGGRRAPEGSPRVSFSQHGQALQPRDLTRLPLLTWCGQTPPWNFDDKVNYSWWCFFLFKPPSFLSFHRRRHPAPDTAGIFTPVGIIR